VGEIKVSIYERVKLDNEWTRVFSACKTARSANTGSSWRWRSFCSRLARNRHRPHRFGAWHEAEDRSNRSSTSKEIVDADLSDR
jgi:hypothetical protein